MKPAEMVMLVIAVLLLLRRVYAHRFEGNRLGGSTAHEDQTHDRRQPLAAASSLLTSRHPEGPQPAERTTTKQPGADKATSPRSLARKFERLGHVVVVRSKLDAKDAAAFAASFTPPVHVVLYDARGIAGELRLPELECLYAREDLALAAAASTVKGARAVLERHHALAAIGGGAEVMRGVVTAHDALAGAGVLHSCLTSITEGGTRYILRADRVMFCSGNTSERMHFRNGVKCAANETVVDMFAGVGYFTLPLACSATPPARIVAIEKNPVSTQLLTLNVAANKIDPAKTRVVVINGDNRESGDEIVGRADRVVMGYIPDCAAFLPRAMQFLKVAKGGDGTARRGTIHYHFLAPSKAEAYSVAHSHVLQELGDEVVGQVVVNAVRVVKSFAPKRWHCVADLAVGPRFVG